MNQDIADLKTADWSSLTYREKQVSVLPAEENA